MCFPQRGKNTNIKNEMKLSFFPFCPQFNFPQIGGGLPHNLRSAAVVSYLLQRLLQPTLSLTLYLSVCNVLAETPSFLNAFTEQWYVNVSWTFARSDPHPSSADLTDIVCRKISNMKLQPKSTKDYVQRPKKNKHCGLT